MLVKSLVLLLILVVVTESYNCTRPLPSNCINHPKIKIGKGSKIYQIILCARGRCLSRGEITDSNKPTWINCSKVCDTCKQIQAPTSNPPKCSNDSQCEETVDSFLNDYCASLFVTPIYSITTADDVNITTTDGRTSIIIGQGALLGLLVALLAVVITGWACTCWTMKKRKEKTTLKSKTAMNSDDNSDGRSFVNIIYDGIGLAPLHPSASLQLEGDLTDATYYDSITAKPSSTQEPTEEDHTYNVLDRGQQNGNNTITDNVKVHNACENEDYSRLDNQNKDDDTHKAINSQAI